VSPLLEALIPLSPRGRSRAAGGFYLVTFVAGIAAVFLRGALGSAADLLAGASYMAVTALFYDLFRPVSRATSLVAALFSVAGFLLGRLGYRPADVDLSIVCFGVYCLLTGSLIARSFFLPRLLGAPMVLAGLGWLTFLSPALARSLRPYNLLPGMVGELCLCLWLVVFGVNDPSWAEQATRGGSPSGI
jgi:hypothetical protein